jgi:hypothetical protein
LCELFVAGLTIVTLSVIGFIDVFTHKAHAAASAPANAAISGNHCMCDHEHSDQHDNAQKRRPRHRRKSAHHATAATASTGHQTHHAALKCASHPCTALSFVGQILRHNWTCPRRAIVRSTPAGGP